MTASALPQPAGVFEEFDVDKAIIPHLIHSQNGTRSTALRELVSNSIDYGRLIGESPHICNRL